MEIKRKTSKGAESSAPHKTPGKLTRLSERERAAADARGGIIDDRLSDRALKALDGLTPDAIDRVKNAIGMFRFFDAAQAARLADAERREQADAISALALALVERMKNLDPALAAHIQSAWWPTHNTVFAAEWRSHAQPKLYQLAALANAAKKAIPKAGRRGAKPKNNRASLLESVTSEFAAAGAGKNLALERARDFLIAAGVCAPTDERNLRRARRQK